MGRLGAPTHIASAPGTPGTLPLDSFGGFMPDKGLQASLPFRKDVQPFTVSSLRAKVNRFCGEPK